MKARRILLSAYACEPGKGSEPGVGWNWAVELARLGHDVWVLTRNNNRLSIEPTVSDLSCKKNLHFLYYDLPRWVCWWKKGGRGIHLYYFLWQWGAYRFAKKYHSIVQFELVHHVTFVSVRQPSFMSLLGIPFVFGPVAGGERAPWRLRLGYGVRGWILDAVRDIANLLVRFDPFMWLTFTKAVRIFTTSEQTLSLLPKKFRQKAQVKLAIAWQGEDIDAKSNYMPQPFSVIYVGHFLYLKGMHLGLAAFARLVKQFPDARLTLVGQGPEEGKWKKIAEKLGIKNNVTWIPWLPQKELPNLYSRHNVLLFPSLHDSGGMVVLEAMAQRLPVVCLDLGGPATIVDDTCGMAIKTGGYDEAEVVSAIAKALQCLAKNPELRAKLADGALERCQAFRWDKMVTSVYSIIDNAFQDMERK